MAKEFIVRVTAPSPSGKSPLKSPPSNESYFYPVTRAVTYWPQVNGNGAFFEEDLLAPLVNSDDPEDGFIGKLANIWHKKGPTTGNKIIGSIKDQAAIKGSGIDLMARIDRKAASTYDIEPEDFGQDGEYSSSSIEILCDFDKSKWVAMTNPESDDLEDQTIFTTTQAEEMGMTRTAETGYLYQGKYTVVEGCYPLRCRGLAFMDNPADPTANVFELAASMDSNWVEETAADALTPGGHYADPGFQPDGKKRYPLDTPDHVRSAAKFWGKAKNRSKYSKEQQDHITSEINKAKKEHNIGEDEVKAGIADDPISGPSYNGFDDMDHHYEDIQCEQLSDAECQKLPDEAFAAAYTDTDGHARIRKLPLYRTPADYQADRPDKGLVKAALHALNIFEGKNPKGGVDLHPHLHAEARNKVRDAHNKLFPQGDVNQVDPKEKEALEQAAFERGVRSRDEEIATLTRERDTATAAVNTKTDEIASLQTKHDELATRVTTLETEKTQITDEKAALANQIAEREKDELAAKRFDELSKIEGFSIKDEEKASLLDTLKAESDTDFRMRKLETENAALKARPAVSIEEQASRQEEEQAEKRTALAMGLDTAPVFQRAKEGEAAKDNGLF